MARAQIKYVVTDQRSGKVIQNAKVYVYETGTTTPVTDLFAALTGGAAIAGGTLISNAQGEVEGYVTTPRNIKLLVTDNGNACYYPQSPGHTLDFPDFPEDPTPAYEDPVEEEADDVALAVNAKSTPYLAAGNGVTDDTAALQGWLDGVLSPAGGHGLLPPGNYRITAPLVIPYSSRWKLEGSSLGSVTITQVTDNTPIFVIDSDLTHSFKITGITFKWLNNQSAANTLAIGIYFRWNGLATADAFNFELDDLEFDNGFRSIAVRQTGTGQLTAWGFKISRIRHNALMTGAMFYSLSPTAIGSPEHHFSDSYLNGLNQSEPLISDSYAEQVLIENVEVNNGDWSTVDMYLFQSCGEITIINSKVETGTVAAATRLWHFVQCNVINLISVGFASLTGTGVGGRMVSGDNGGILNIMGMRNQATISGGGRMIAYVASSIGLVSGVTTSGNVTRFARDDLGTTPVPKVNVDNYTDDDSIVRGDVDVTMTIADYRVQIFQSTLTANRTITLPSTNVIRGMEYEIIRNAATPGAFTLTVNDPLSAKNVVFASGAKGFARYRAYAGQWMLMATGVLP